MSVDKLQGLRSKVNTIDGGFRATLLRTSLPLEQGIDSMTGVILAVSPKAQFGNNALRRFHQMELLSIRLDSDDV